MKPTCHLLFDKARNIIPWYGTVAFLLYLTLPSYASTKEKDTITYRSAIGPTADFDGDGQVDTLYYSVQQLENKGKVRKARRLPGFIVWADKNSKLALDTTTFDVSNDPEVIVGVRVDELSGDKIQDIELVYRWSETSKKGVKSVEEKIWLIKGGDDLRSERTLTLQEVKKSLTTSSDIVSERSSSVRGSEQPVTIGSYAIRRILGNVQLSKAPVVQDEIAPTLPASITIAPNPSNDVIRVRWDAPDQVTQLEILDAQGRSVKSLTIAQSSRGSDEVNVSEQEVDIGSLASGSYTLRLGGCTACPLSSPLVVVR